MSGTSAFLSAGVGAVANPNAGGGVQYLITFDDLDGFEYFLAFDDLDGFEYLMIGAA